MMQVNRLRRTDALVYCHTCEECGLFAPFGVGVHLRRALNALELKRANEAKEYLGKWYCLTHWRLLPQPPEIEE